MAIDTSTTTITNATIVGSTLVLTSSIELNAANTTGGGGFSVTGSDSTAYTIDSVDVSGFTITITLDSNVAPTNKGTYSYDPGSTSALSVTNIHNVVLAAFNSIDEVNTSVLPTIVAFVIVVVLVSIATSSV